MSQLSINAKKQGFTIVELLIVIVIIAILATISIVNYNGAIAKANKSSAIATASTLQKKAEVYNADETINRYPVTPAELSADSSKPWYITGNITFAAATSTITSSNGKNTVVVRKCAAGTPANQAAITSANVTGLQIFYWDYDANAVTTTPLTVGSNTSGTTTCPAS